MSVYLFLLYINDLAKETDFGELFFFADDTVLIIEDDNINTVMQKANHDLSKIYNWFNVNKLKCNIAKSKIMTINDKTKSDITIKIGQQQIERVQKYKYLGVILDDKMCLDDNFAEMTKKIATKTDQAILKKFTLENRRKIYKKFGI